MTDYRPPLSKRQRQIMDFIRGYIDEHGWAPTLREIGAAVELNSTSSVANQLSILQARGYLRRNERQPRAIAVIE